MATNAGSAGEERGAGSLERRGVGGGAGGEASRAPSAWNARRRAPTRATRKPRARRDGGGGVNARAREGHARGGVREHRHAGRQDARRGVPIRATTLRRHLRATWRPPASVLSRPETTSRANSRRFRWTQKYSLPSYYALALVVSSRSRPPGVSIRFEERRVESRESRAHHRGRRPRNRRRSRRLGRRLGRRRRVCLLAPLLRDVLGVNPRSVSPPRHPRSVPFRLPRHHRVLRESLPPRTNANRREGHPRGFERRASGSAEQPTRLRRHTQTPVARMDRLHVLRRGPARFVLRLLLLFCPYIFLLKHRRRHHLRGSVARARARGHDSVFERLL